MNSQHEICLELTLVDEGSRWVDSAPQGINVGALQLQKWQVDPVGTSKTTLDGMDRYLIKVNYELDLGPYCPPVTWFEVGFNLAGDGGEDITVVDARPHSTQGPQGDSAFVLTTSMHLAPSTGDSVIEAHVPATSDIITVFGIGSSEIRWRHMCERGGAVRPGSHTAWLVLETRSDRAELKIDFAARYALSLEAPLDYRPVQGVRTFALGLCEPRFERAFIEPAIVVETEPEEERKSFRVFIHYAHDDEAHKKAALRFGQLLCRSALDVRLDRWCEDHRKSWDIWALHEIEAADFVIVLASPKCRAVWGGEVCDERNRGMQSESGILRNKLHTCRSEWTRKLLPVVLPGESVDNIPELLQPRTADYYLVDDFDEAGVADLLRAMYGKPLHQRPPLGTSE